MKKRKMGAKTYMTGFRAAALLLTFLFAFSLLLPFGSLAKGSGKVVRVGWYESPFNRTDEFGRRSGYAYDFQQKIAAYTGWTYEYVNGSWPELLQMLLDGKIDLLSDVSFTEERAQKLLYSTLPMGSEDYYVFVNPDNAEITAENLSSLNGKKVGINKDSVQVGFFKEWMAANGVSADVIELTISEEEALDRMRRGVIDAYVSLGGFFEASVAMPVCKIGSSDFYFAIGNSQHELLDEMNTAMIRVHNENPYYVQLLNAKYLNITAVSLFLTAEENAWLADHGTIRVGYQDNYLAFCAKDPDSGELTGALKDYLHAASDSLENAHLDFEAICYPTAAAAMEALKKGEVDCMFPANLTDYDGETQGYFMTSPIMRTDISAIVLQSEAKGFSAKERVSVAVNAGNPNYNMFLIDNFPEWRSIVFEDTAACLAAIAEKKADCLLISNYRYNNISALCRKYDLVSMSTGVEMDYCFAVRRSDTLLYSILNKIASAVPDSSVNAALSYYFTEDAKLGFGELLLQNIGVLAAIVFAVLSVIFLLVIHVIRSRKKASDSERLINATETDPLTGLYVKSFFYEYAERTYRENPEKQMDAIVLNIEQFHSINAIHGWAFGDHILRVLGDEINAFISEKGGIAGHAEADRFAIYCPHVENPHELFVRLQKRLDELSPNAGILLRMGVMPWEKNVTPHQLVEQALIACGLARGRYKEHMVVFDGYVRERENYERRLKNDMNRALTNKEFEVHYQPKYDISSDKPRLASVEALVRWNHPEFGMIPPGDFIPLFEENGQISEIDKYVWEEAISQIARWKERYGVVIPVSVNLSRLDIFDSTLENTFDLLLEKYELDCSALHLEVTESAYTENSNQVIEVIRSLRKKGYEIEMDDFGTGYSSLNMLSDMPIDMLKMDRAFIRNIDRNNKDVQLVEVILDIAKKLNVPVIAEGVETEMQLNILKKLGCEQVQGFYFSRPLPATEFEKEFLKKTEA